MKPYAELLEFNQPNPIRKVGFTRIRDSFPGLSEKRSVLLDGRGIGQVYNPERISEFAGRWDYGSKNAAKLGTPAKDGTPIIAKWLASGEQSMLEMGHASVFIECSRVVSHELVRHRLASFQQESQRFTKYEDAEDWEFFYNPMTEDDVIEGPAIQAHYVNALKLYKDLRAEGVSPQLARYVLPNATRTRIIMSANMREWRHIIKLRLHSSAQPEMRELMKQIYEQLKDIFPQSLEGVLEEGRGVR